MEVSEDVYSMADTAKTGPSEDVTDTALNDDADGVSSKGPRKKPRR